MIENEKLNETEKNAFLEKAMVTLDDYLNAGCKETRKKAAENAKFLYKEYYGVDYVNRSDRSVRVGVTSGFLTI